MLATMRIGVMIGDHVGPDALARVSDEVRRAADDGLASVWISHVFGLDALTALAVAGSRVPDIELGTAVVPTYPRHPAALAQQARTTALAVGPGRLTLGVGLSHQVVIENMFGYDFSRPARHMKEYLAVLGPLLDGEPVSFSGETVTANIGLTAQSGRVPILVAALGPRLLELAARAADGTVLWMTGPTTVREHIVPVITAAAEAAGRPSPRVVCELPVCVTDDIDRARAKAAKAFQMYGSLPSYRAMMDREGVRGPEDLAVIGSEEEVSARIGEIEAAGATDFVAVPFIGGEAGERTRALLARL
jgi:F420-dependent oxidoreductase-like protein